MHSWKIWCRERDTRCYLCSIKNFRRWKQDQAVLRAAGGGQSPPRGCGENVEREHEEPARDHAGQDREETWSNMLPMINFQSFRFSNVCFWSYLSRTVLEIFLSIGLFLIYWCWGMPNLQRNIDCDVHGLK